MKNSQAPRLLYPLYDVKAVNKDNNFLPKHLRMLYNHKLGITLEGGPLLVNSGMGVIVT